MLDGMHEDVNRIRAKPKYKEIENSTETYAKQVGISYNERVLNGGIITKQGMIVISQISSGDNS
jgi:hypothetical protein